jgi:predicted secreted protein
MTLAIDAYGTLLQSGDGGSPEAFTTIAEVTDITGPGLVQDPLDVTSHESPGAFREFVGGLLDGGEVTFTINYVPTAATHDASTGLIADMIARIIRNYQLVFPDVGATTWSFSALIAAFEPAEPVDDRLSAEVTLKVTGQPTLA